MAQVRPLTFPRECSACLEIKSATNIYIAPCDHAYCHDCVLTVFNDSLHDSSVFPPRCCRREFTIASVSDILGPDLTLRANLKVIELDTVDKTYCARPACAAFIPPHFIDGTRGTCTACQAGTCVQCKAAYHHGRCEPEPEVDTDQQAVEFAQAQGWRRCYNCQSFVELTHGCNHMTCRCRAEFCYTCGARWKTCACTWVDRARLLARPAGAAAVAAAELDDILEGIFGGMAARPLDPVADPRAPFLAHAERDAHQQRVQDFPFWPLLDPVPIAVEYRAREPREVQQRHEGNARVIWPRLERGHQATQQRIERNAREIRQRVERENQEAQQQYERNARAIWLGIERENQQAQQQNDRNDRAIWQGVEQEAQEAQQQHERNARNIWQRVEQEAQDAQQQYERNARDIEQWMEQEAQEMQQQFERESREIQQRMEQEFQGLRDRRAREAARLRNEREAREAEERRQRDAREAQQRFQRAAQGVVDWRAREAARLRNEREAREAEERRQRDAREAQQRFQRAAQGTIDWHAREVARLRREAREAAAQLEREARQARLRVEQALHGAANWWGWREW